MKRDHSHLLATGSRTTGREDRPGQISPSRLSPVCLARFRKVLSVRLITKRKRKAVKEERNEFVVFFRLSSPYTRSTRVTSALGCRCKQLKFENLSSVLSSETTLSACTQSLVFQLVRGLQIFTTTHVSQDSSFRLERAVTVP